MGTEKKTPDAEVAIVALIRNEGGTSYYFHFRICGATKNFHTKSQAKFIAKSLAEKGTIDRQDFLAAIALLPQGELETRSRWEHLDPPQRS